VLFSKIFISHFDQLVSYTRRLKAQANKTNQATNTNSLIAELGDNNPFSERPSTAQQTNIYEIETEQFLGDLDKYENAPSGVDLTVWQRFIQFRRQRIALENNLRIKGLTYSDIYSYLQKRMEEDELLKKEIEDYNQEIVRFENSLFYVVKIFGLNV
jgi:hypothetical protein